MGFMGESLYDVGGNRLWISGGRGRCQRRVLGFLRLRTDQVRFYPIGAPENLAHACGGEYTM